MSNQPTIEQRLEIVEKAIAELQQRLVVSMPAVDWLEKISGSFKDEPAFEEVLRYGRAFRDGDQV